MVYFIQGEITRLIKIGYAVNVKRRFSALQSASPDRLAILGYVKGEMELEKALHRHFKHLRVLNEWFRPEQDLLEFIRRGEAGKKLEWIRERVQQWESQRIDAMIDWKDFSTRRHWERSEDKGGTQIWLS